jgi:hypothetical protein
LFYICSTQTEKNKSGRPFIAPGRDDNFTIMTKQTTTPEKWANLPFAVQEQLAKINPKLSLNDKLFKLERLKNDLRALSYSLDYDASTGEIKDVYRVEVVTFGSFGNTLGRPLKYTYKYIASWGYVREEEGVLRDGEIFKIEEKGDILILDLR